MRMVDHRAGGEGHPVPVRRPALAQVAVLEVRQVHLEAVQRPKALGGDGHVVRGEVPIAVAVRVVVVVQHVVQELRCLRERTAPERVQSPAPERVARRGPMKLGKPAQPARRRQAVVVDEGQQLAVSEPGSGVSGRSRPTALGALHSNPQPVPVLLGHRAHGLWGAVVHHDHLEPVAWVVEGEHRLEAGRKLARPGVGRDDDRDRRELAGHGVSGPRGRRPRGWSDRARASSCPRPRRPGCP